jgi:hypothetical protein
MKQLQHLIANINNRHIPPPYEVYRNYFLQF